MSLELGVLKLLLLLARFTALTNVSLYPNLHSEVRTIYTRRLNKESSSKYSDGYPNQQWVKCSDINNKDKDNSSGVKIIIFGMLEYKSCQ